MNSNRCPKHSFRRLTCGFALGLSFLTSASLKSAAADHTYQRALGYYARGEFAQACPLFAQACTKTADPLPLYYYASTLQGLGQFDKAKDTYQQLLQRYPHSRAAELSMSALSALKTRPDLLQTEKKQVEVISTKGASESLPQEAQLHFDSDEHNLYIVDAFVNNRPINMVFDTGSETCTFGKNHLAQLGVPVPQGKPLYKAIGVGKNAPVPTWQTTVDLKVGNIVRRNFRIDVQDYLDKPLLGQTFFDQYSYAVDGNLHLIQFTTHKSASPGSTYSVHFVRQRDNLLVPATINGKSIKMIFDTGASGICFSLEDMKKLGIAVPENAIAQQHIGIGGEAEGIGFEVDRLRVGPIERQNVRISVVKGIMEGYPLLGQSFLQNWRYTIDNRNSVINFEHQ